MSSALRPQAPLGAMRPLGYVVMQPSMRPDRPVKAYQRWLERISATYAADVLDPPNEIDPGAETATVRNYRSLMPLAHDAHKPMFDPKPADGAVGSTQRYVQTCFTEFRGLARAVLDRVGLNA